MTNKVNISVTVKKVKFSGFIVILQMPNITKKWKLYNNILSLYLYCPIKSFFLIWEVNTIALFFPLFFFTLFYCTYDAGHYQSLLLWKFHFVLVLFLSSFIPVTQKPPTSHWEIADISEIPFTWKMLAWIVKSVFVKLRVCPHEGLTVSHSNV